MVDPRLHVYGPFPRDMMHVAEEDGFCLEIACSVYEAGKVNAAKSAPAIAASARKELVLWFTYGRHASRNETGLADGPKRICNWRRSCPEDEAVQARRPGKEINPQHALEKV